MKFLRIVFLLLLPTMLHAQVVTLNGVAAKISSGLPVRVNGDVNNRAGSILQTDGTLTIAGSFTNAGTANGSGTLSYTGTLTHTGIVAPGSSPAIGKLTVTGNYPNGTGALNIDLGGATTPGTNYDQLAVSGTATLSGALNVSLVNSFSITPGQSFTILTASSVSGTFTTTNLPTGLTVQYNPTNVVLTTCTGLSVSPGNVNITWTGLAGTDWNTACNWSPAWVPDLTNALAIIPNTTNKPVITGTVQDVKAIDIQTNALLTVSGTGVLNVRGDGGINKGIWLNKGALTNASGGRINIQSSSNTAVDAYIYLTTDATTGATFTNSGTVTINSTDEAIGVGNVVATFPAQVTNTATGIINIVNGIGVEVNASTDVLNFVNAGTINYNGTALALKFLGTTTFTNTGTVNINSGAGIENPLGSTIANNACGKILMASGTYTNGGTTNNTGLIQMPNAYDFANIGTFTNNGVLKANSVVGVANNKLVITNACPMFTVGGTNSYTVSGVFTSSAATTSAGTYTTTGNKFTANNTIPTGTQTLYAQVSNGTCTFTIPFDFNNIKPTSVSVNATSICAGNSVTLTGACSTGTLTWYTSATASTSIGTGTSLAQSPSVTTTYYAACETANCASGRVATGEVTVFPIPTAPTAANVSICTGTMASLTASCGGGGSVKWYDAATGGTFLSASNPYTTSALTTQTDFYASCETSVVVCTSPTRTKVTVSINPLPVATLTSSVSGTLTCANPSLTLTATGGTSYVFSGLSVVSSNGTAGTATVNASGVYSVTVINTATGCSSVTSTTVSSNTNTPTVSIAPVSGTLTCTITSLTLTASATGATYAWTGGTTGATLAVSTSGTYSVTATAANGCTAVSNSALISQNIAPPTPGLVASGTVTCAVPAITLTASGAGLPGGNTYVFSGPGIVSSSGALATINLGGVYSVTATNTANGCTASTTVTVFSNFTAQAPTVSLNTSISTICEGSSVRVVATVGGAITGYQWYRNGQIVSGQTSATLNLGSVQTNQAGSYVLVVSSGCGSLTSSAFVLTVNPLPTVSLLVPNNASVSGATITLPLPLTNVNFQVLGGGSFERVIILDRVNGFEIRQVETNANGIFPINRNGPFRLTVTDGNGCRRTVEGAVVVQP